MKVVIFAGGLGTRLQGETALEPKPMLDIGGRLKRPAPWTSDRTFMAACGRGVAEQDVGKWPPIPPQGRLSLVVGPWYRPTENRIESKP